MVSDKAIEYHLGNIYAKLGLSSARSSPPGTTSPDLPTRRAPES